MTNQPSAMMIQPTGRHGRPEYRVFYPSPNGQRETCKLVDERDFYAIKERAGEPSFQDGAYWAFETQPAPAQAVALQPLDCPFCRTTIVVFWKGLYCPTCLVEWADEEDMNADRPDWADIMETEATR